MNLVIKYSIKNTVNAAQMPNDATAQGINGVNFSGASVNLAMALAQPVSANNSDKGSILPSTNNLSDGTYVDKIVAIAIPAVLDATTVTYLSVTLDKIGINTDIVGVEILGLNRTETNVVAAFAKNVLLDSNLGFSVSKNRLIVTIGVSINTIAGSVLNLRVTYKN
jgi:hypothetical protein